MKRIHIVNGIFLALSLCFAFAIPVLGIGTAMTNWDGMCYGFTDSQLPCSWWEFAKNEMFWGSFMFVPLLGMTLATWWVVNIIHWVVRARRRTNSTATK